MAQFGKDVENITASSSIKIIDTETVETYTLYVIQVTIGPYSWTVKHRYSDFYFLHEKLCSTSKLDRNLLPPKKLFGNQSETFIKKRQNDLETYLQTVLYFVSQKMPNCLATFLSFENYEIHGITQVMAEELYNKGDLLLQSRDVYKTTPLHLYALTERLKLPEPTCESGDVKRDLGHILDFITRLKCLQVTGKIKVGTSNIEMNALQFDLTLFKSLQTLELISCEIGLVGGLEVVKQTLQRLTVNKSIASIKEVLLQDLPHWKADDGSLLVTYWDGITHVDFSHNSVTDIDDSMQLLPKVVHLDLSHNKISAIQNLQWLSHMVHLDMSYNNIEQLEALHSKLGNLKTLKLAGNRLKTLQGLSKLFSLVHLDLSYNQVAQVDDIRPICRLPCLEDVMLLGNPVTITLDYRTKTLALFGDRVSELSFDKCKADQKELDTVAVLQALQKAKDKAKDVNIRKGNSSASLSEMSQSPVASSLGRIRSDLQGRIHRNSSSGAILSDDEGQGQSESQVHVQSNSLSHIYDNAQSDIQGDSQGRTHSNSSSVTNGNRQSGNSGNSQTTGNQVRQSQPLLQKYKLFIRQSNIPALDSSSSTSSPMHGRPTRSSAPNKAISAHAEASRSPSAVQNNYTQLNHRTGEFGQHPSSIPLPSSTHFVHIASLPDHMTTDFSQSVHTRLFGKGDDSNQTSQEVIKYILWCPVVQYSTGAQTPCCVVLTERRIFILQLKASEPSTQDVPALETFYILPLCNIQQVLVGPCYSFVRVEESFVGASGTFAFLVADSDKGREFMEELKKCCQSDNGEDKDAALDLVNCCQDSDLSKQIFEAEENSGECTGRIAFAAHVRKPDEKGRVYLVMSENHVYLVKSCVLFWPKPTFDVIKIESEKRFEVMEQFSVEAKISEINMYHVGDSKEDSFPPITPTSNIKYQEYGLSMLFHETLGFHWFDYHFLSTKARDSFLDQLTTLRGEHAHRMSPTLRQEPEGGNESSESSDEQKRNGKPHSASIYSETEDSDIERLSDPESCENDTKTSGSLQDEEVVAVSRRKIRSKTEIIIPKILEQSGEETRELPSYTLHYLTPELISHLETCVKMYTLFKPISCKLQAIREMTGENLAQYFHTNIVPVGIEGEELHHVVWTNVVPYTNPKDEVVTCVMVSNRAVYFVSDRPVVQKSSRPSWMTHARHVSDSVIGLQSKMADKHHSSGILLTSENDASIVRPYCILDFADIQQINVGLFDQCLRLTGKKRENVFTLVTRNSETTSLFLKNLSSMLSLYIASPMLDKSSSDLEQDFYKAFDKRTKTTIEGIEYVHPSKVKFCYPGDEAISDLLFLINEHLRSMSLRVGRENILQYIVGYKTQLFTSEVDSVVLEPISIILTNECLCFVTEDLVSYPLPDFVRGLPSMPRHHVTEVKKIEYLKTIKQNQSNSRDITLTFSDEKEDIVLVPDHYSLDENDGRFSPPEIPVRLFIQSERELNKFMILVQSQWKEIHQDEKDLIINDA